MTETTNAEKLRIGDGFVVWIIGASVEETSLLDPLPEGAETIEVRDEDEPENVDAAILVTDDRTALTDDFDEVLPQLGSIPIVWITYPLTGHSDLDEDTLQDLIGDYGWSAVESIALDETWAAMRILQS
ncbi:hypothetical protein ASE12_17160 [Aeromicrobium sp. Root236]|uniref:DUF3052 family protein n=1 Tax=Aeromicrobium sp. Root236 TaxID=1736498 RepID=UPI0006FE34A5|nr:DUF3052 family protein [Aeromicrobium sp. Root236]KRC66334.1 hypothetical protein ASE12_17160 [Aeromicrobium sp. Root236]